MFVWSPCMSDRSRSSAGSSRGCAPRASTHSFAASSWPRPKRLTMKADGSGAPCSFFSAMLMLGTTPQKSFSPHLIA